MPAVVEYVGRRWLVRKLEGDRPMDALPVDAQTAALMVRQAVDASGAGEIWTRRQGYQVDLMIGNPVAQAAEAYRKAGRQ